MTVRFDLEEVYHHSSSHSLILTAHRSNFYSFPVYILTSQDFSWLQKGQVKSVSRLPVIFFLGGGFLLLFLRPIASKLHKRQSRTSSKVRWYSFWCTPREGLVSFQSHASLWSENMILRQVEWKADIHFISVGCWIQILVSIDTIPSPNSGKVYSIYGVSQWGGGWVVKGLCYTNCYWTFSHLGQNNLHSRKSIKHWSALITTNYTCLW